MKNSYIFTAVAATLALASCADDYNCSTPVEKPESVVEAERIAALDVLNSYIDRDNNPNFKLGVGVGSDDYASQGLTYSIAKTNFDFVVDPAALSYGSVVGEDWTPSFTAASNMFLENGPAVAAGALIAYNAVNVAQLNDVISPTFVKGDLEMGTLTLFDFENEAIGTEYTMTNGSVATIVEDPAEPAEKCLRVGSPENKARNSYPELKISLPDGLTLGNCLTVRFDIFCVDDNSLKKNLVMLVNGHRKNFTGDTAAKRGCPLNEWGRRIIELDITAVDIPAEELTSSEFTLALGPNLVSTYYYMDNVSISWQRGEPDKYVEKTAEEKAQVLRDNFTSWADAMMAVTAPSISDYVAVANPMSDDDLFGLRTAENEEILGLDTTNSFFFNDYMGDNYVADLTNALADAYAANGGNATLHLYVGESNLLGNPGKVTRLLNQIRAWETAGAKIHGIAIDLPLAYSADEATQRANENAVSALFKAVAASGKLIRLDNVHMADANPDFYAYVINSYFTEIPSAQRAGIVFASNAELWKNATRTPVYESIANSLNRK